MRALKIKRRNFVALGAVTMTLILGAGCRFGNHSDSYIPPNTAIFKTADLYYLHPISIVATVYLADASQPSGYIVKSSPPLSTIHIPSENLDTFTDPIYIATTIKPGLPPFFVNVHGDLNSAKPTGLATDGSISYDNSANPPAYYLWRDSICYYAQVEEHKGTLDLSTKGTHTLTDGSTEPINGTIKMNYTQQRVFSSGCTQSFAALATCYISGVGCSADDLKKAHEVYDLYVGAGLINLNDPHLDFSSILGLEYTVKYDTL